MENTLVEYTAILGEVLDVIQTNRKREGRRENVGLAIRTVAQRRRMARWQVEQALDGALAFRRA